MGHRLYADVFDWLNGMWTGPSVAGRLKIAQTPLPPITFSACNDQTNFPEYEVIAFPAASFHAGCPKLCRYLLRGAVQKPFRLTRYRYGAFG